MIPPSEKLDKALAFAERNWPKGCSCPEETPETIMRYVPWGDCNFCQAYKHAYETLTEGDGDGRPETGNNPSGG